VIPAPSAGVSVPKLWQGLVMTKAPYPRHVHRNPPWWKNQKSRDSPAVDLRQRVPSGAFVPGQRLCCAWAAFGTWWGRWGLVKNSAAATTTGALWQRVPFARTSAEKARFTSRDAYVGGGRALLPRALPHLLLCTLRSALSCPSRDPPAPEPPHPGNSTFNATFLQQGR
jgi:hypothetical protein